MMGESAERRPRGVPLLELAPVTKLTDEPGHRIGMNPEELGGPAFMTLRGA